MTSFLDDLSSTLFLGDGDFQTALESTGRSRVPFPEGLNLSDPDAVTAVHNLFLSAGAKVIRTNSLHARFANLDAHGLTNRLNELHWQAAQLAKSAARGTGAIVAGAVSEEENGTPAAYQARIGALLDGGCDAIFFEDFTRLEELVMALHVKQSLHHCPAICSMTRSDGEDFSAVFRKLENEGADVLGGPYEATLAVNEPTLPKVFVLAREESNPQDSLTPMGYADRALVINRRGGGLLFGGRGIAVEYVATANGKMKTLED